MSLTFATLLPGLLLVVFGLPLLLANSAATAALRSFPRSSGAAIVLFGGATLWFLYNIWNLSDADFGAYHVYLFIGFAAVSVLAFKCIPDFLAVRGACVLILLAAAPLLGAAYMEFAHPQRLFMVVPVYLVLTLAIWIGAQPWRARDFIGWLLARPVRARALGGFLTVYGLGLCAIAFTY
jgi:hypothetical protein